MNDKEMIRHLSNEISDRHHVAAVMNYDMASNKEYVTETNRLIKQKQELSKKLEEHYLEILNARVGMYENVNEFIDRMESTANTDSEGNIVFDYFKLGISAIDDEFFNGKGVFQNSFIAIGADSSTGKTTLALQMIANLAYQNIQSQFYSFEMGDRQFFNEIAPQAKNKLAKIAKTEYAKNLFLDFHSRTIKDLAMSIQMRAEDGVRAFVIDSYLSIYAGTDDFKKMKEVVDMLATLKKELGILIILIAQISKSDSFNNVWDFHGGTTLKYESDVALFIRLLDGEENTTKRHIHCDKNRIFEDKQKYGIVTDYNRETHKIEKVCLFKDYAGLDGNGKTLRPLKLKNKP
jgi:predicted ATP-dependent serine protease